MTPLRTILDRLHQAFGDGCSWAFRHPFLVVRIESTCFANMDDDDSEISLADILEISLSEFRDISARCMLRLELSGEGGVSKSLSSHGASWLELLTHKEGVATASGDAPNYVHFYGFKGGQARTTALCATATSLARDGWRVLVVDLDAEAPTLDLMLNATTNDVSQTILGLRAGEFSRPVSVVRTARGGEVSILPFRPRGEIFDLDAAALTFELQVYAPAIDKTVAKIAELAPAFDLVLIDHRTGFGSIVPGIVASLKGPVVVCARLDKQSEHALSAISALWAASTEAPGMLLSLGHPDQTPEQYRKESRPEASTLLQALANASARGDEDEPREWSEFLDHWVVWPFDRIVATRGIVAQDAVNFTPAIAELRRILGLQHHIQRHQKQSGAKDEGDLIVTQALRQLRSPDSAVTLIAGRKGTGKTRLVRQLAEEGLGEPLLVPSDFDPRLGGVKAGDLEIRSLAVELRGNEERFWYALLCAAVESESTKEIGFVTRIREIVSSGRVIERFRKSASALSKRRTFLIDALESTFDHEQTFPFVQALFRVVESIEATPDVNDKVLVRMFVRRDLLERGIQNREQFEEGHRFDLTWDVQTILNFVLTRIGAIEWYSRVSPALVRRIGELSEQLREGQVESEECEEMLLMLFPVSIQYKNIKTTTFLRTYFSDEGREPSFYPRVYLVFLEEIAKQHAKALVKGKIDGKVIVKAHDVASANFLQEVSQELNHAVGVPQTVIAAVFSGLVGKTTPFSPDQLAKTISNANSKTLSAGEVRKVFDVMKQLGVFEDHPKRLNTWRAGRLFKTGLRMKFTSGN